MTDEQLFRVEEMTLRACQSNVWLTRMLSETLADYRRLRDLERACKRLFWRTEHGERYMPAQSLHGTNEREAIATIGRLLEGEG